MILIINCILYDPVSRIDSWKDNNLIQLNLYPLQ